MCQGREKYLGGGKSNSLRGKSNAGRAKWTPLSHRSDKKFPLWGIQLCLGKRCASTYPPIRVLK